DQLAFHAHARSAIAAHDEFGRAIDHACAMLGRGALHGRSNPPSIDARTAGYEEAGLIRTQYRKQAPRIGRAPALDAAGLGRRHGARTCATLGSIEAAGVGSHTATADLGVADIMLAIPAKHLDQSRVVPRAMCEQRVVGFIDRRRTPGANDAGA